MEPRIAPMRNYNAANNTRRCKKCNQWLDLNLFNTRVRMPSPSTKTISKLVPTLYYREICKACSITQVRKSKYTEPVYRRALHKKDPRKVMLINARKRAQDKNLPFNITKSDLVIPERCPLLDIPLIVGSGIVCDNSPTIDRIIGEKGYVKGNVQIISHKANAVKSNLSLTELELLVSNLKRVLYKEEELLEN